MRCTVLLVLVVLAFSSSLVGSAFADRIEVSSVPVMGAAAKSGEPAATYPVEIGSSYQLQVDLHHDDGSVSDVTGHTDTAYEALLPSRVSVDGGGLISAVQSGGGAIPPAVVVMHGSLMATLRFHVSQ